MRKRFDVPSELDFLTFVRVDYSVFAPKLGAKQHPDGRITSPPLEDLSPFLPREVLRANMLIDMIED